MTTGRNFDEVLRVIDSLQLTGEHKVSTPANWRPGGDVIIAGSVSDEQAKEIFGSGSRPALHSDRPATPLAQDRDGLGRGERRVEVAHDRGEPPLHRLFHSAQREHVPLPPLGKHRGGGEPTGILRGTRGDRFTPTSGLLPGRVAAHRRRHPRASVRPTPPATPTCARSTAGKPISSAPSSWERPATGCLPPS